jgi:hypothetical protein
MVKPGETEPRSELFDLGRSLVVVSILDPWQPWSLEQVSSQFAEAPFRWWISGGHALELHAEDQWRSQADIDVGVCRNEMSAVYSWFDGWDLSIAAAGRLVKWDGRRPLDAHRQENNVWVRESLRSPWRVDLTIGSVDTGEWTYRRDETVTRPWHRAVLRTESGLPYLAPDLQLLFKAKDPRPVDHLDAEQVIEVLNLEERRFLAGHLDPEHSWHSLMEANPPHSQC